MQILEFTENQQYNGNNTAYFFCQYLGHDGSSHIVVLNNDINFISEIFFVTFKEKNF